MCIRGMVRGRVSYPASYPCPHLLISFLFVTGLCCARYSDAAPDSPSTPPPPKGTTMRTGLNKNSTATSSFTRSHFRNCRLPFSKVSPFNFRHYSGPIGSQGSGKSAIKVLIEFESGVSSELFHRDNWRLSCPCRTVYLPPPSS